MKQGTRPRADRLRLELANRLDQSHASLFCALCCWAKQCKEIGVDLTCLSIQAEFTGRTTRIGRHTVDLSSPLSVYLVSVTEPRIDVASATTGWPIS